MECMPPASPVTTSGDVHGVHALESVEEEANGRWRSLAGRLFTAEGKREQVAHEGPEAYEA